MTLKSHDPADLMQNSDTPEDEMRLDQIQAEGTLTKQAVDDSIMHLSELARTITRMNETELPSESRKLLVSMQSQANQALLSAKDAQTYLRYGKRE